MAKHTINIRSGEGMTPEELQEGLASGKFKPIREDEKIDVSKHKRFVTVPKSILPDLQFRTDGIISEIPPGAEHRILDKLSSGTSHVPPINLHRAHHFKLGFKASEYLLELSVDQLAREQIEYAPHPFDEYTVSLWAGTEDGVAEVLVMVTTAADGTPMASLMWLVWGKEYVVPGLKMTERSASLDIGADSQTILAWILCDAFRLLMAHPAGRTIMRGGPPRSAIRKGKRVHFYSASEIKIDLDAAKRDRVVAGNGFGKMMPVYQYRAHLCHSGGQRGCEHFWIEIGGVMRDGLWVPDKDHPKQNPNWECYHCGRRRWHRKAGTRGSAEVGYVRQTYNVVKGDDE